MKTIKDGNGRTIALILETSNQKKVYAANGVTYLGHYSSVSKATFDASNRRIGDGDQTGRLIR